jgi:hypothetical protein
MGLKVTANNNSIAQQINNFPKKYHKGFFAKDYLGNLFPYHRAGKKCIYIIAG